MTYLISGGRIGGHRVARVTSSIKNRAPLLGLGGFWDAITGAINQETSNQAINALPTPPDDAADAGTPVDVSAPTQDASGGLFVSTGGVCKPTTPAMLGYYKDLQRQANRIAADIGASKLTVDGAIGANTVGLLQKIKATLVTGGAYAAGAGILTGDVSTCAAVAGNYYAIMAALEQAADALGLPSSVASPSAPSTYVDLSTGTKKDPGVAGSIGDLFGNMSTTEKLVLGGVAAAVAYLAVKRGKRRTFTRRRR